VSDPFYQTKAWWKLRAATLKRATRCGICERLLLPGDRRIVDHKVPRRVAPDRALDPTNLWVLHATCHESVKKRMEAGKSVPVVGLDGWPEG
jgi:5-methylcytosine-specific restriction endonuclease McrA